MHACTVALFSLPVVTFFVCHWILKMVICTLQLFLVVIFLIVVKKKFSQITIVIIFFAEI